MCPPACEGEDGYQLLSINTYHTPVISLPLDKGLGYALSATGQWAAE